MLCKFFVRSTIFGTRGARMPVQAAGYIDAALRSISDVSDAALTLVWGSRAAKVVPQSMVGFWCFNRLRS